MKSSKSYCWIEAPYVLLCFPSLAQFSPFFIKLHLTTCWVPLRHESFFCWNNFFTTENRNAAVQQFSWLSVELQPSSSWLSLVVFFIVINCYLVYKAIESSFITVSLMKCGNVRFESFEPRMRWRKFEHHWWKWREFYNKRKQRISSQSSVKPSISKTSFRKYADNKTRIKDSRLLWKKNMWKFWWEHFGLTEESLMRGICLRHHFQAESLTIVH